jgi:folate-binding protein YgfZ
MNPLWKNFLLSSKASFENDESIVFPVCQPGNEKRIYPLAHLAVLSVTGKDAASLLQGQVTCNVNEVTAYKSTLGAMCNPKGRVITTFLLLKKEDGFLLILPKALLEPIKKRLQMYVLRSVVTLADSSDTLCLIGLSAPDASPLKQFDSYLQNGTIFVSLSSLQNRQLIVADTDSAIALWSDYVSKQGFQPDSPGAWRYLDILSGIPWLSAETSEEFIPQMLNLDKLGGISFNKGCYTGQEVVARTHYLGKAKRALFLAESDLATEPAANATIFDDNLDNSQGVGHVLMAQCHQNSCKMLVVLHVSDKEAYNLKLADQTQLTLII